MLELSVGESDYGQVIGRGGGTAQHREPVVDEPLPRPAKGNRARSTSSIDDRRRVGAHLGRRKRPERKRSERSVRAGQVGEHTAWTAAFM